MWPVERYRPLNMLFRNTGIWDAELGQNYVPTNADDFKRVLQQLNRPNEDRYAVEGVNIQYNLQVFPAMFGAPNGWALDSAGKLTRDIETPEYKEAVGYVRDLIATGLYHPDFIQNLANAASTGATQTFAAGKAAVIVYTFGVNWSTLWSTAHAAQPPVDFLPIGLFPAHDGGKLGHFLGPGFIATNGMKQASPDRIKELLRVVDWLAAPFGSQEDLLLTYGLKDTEYSLDPGRVSGAAAGQSLGHTGGAVAVRGAASAGHVFSELSGLRPPGGGRREDADPGRHRGPHVGPVRTLDGHGRPDGRPAGAGHADGHPGRPPRPQRVRPDGQGLAEQRWESDAHGVRASTSERFVTTFLSEFFGSRKLRLSPQGGLELVTSLIWTSKAAAFSPGRLELVTSLFSRKLRLSPQGSAPWTPRPRALLSVAVTRIRSPLTRALSTRA